MNTHVRTILIASSLLCSSARADIISIVNQPRPIFSAIDDLQDKTGFVITYEDVELSFPDDEVDVTRDIGRDPNDGRPHLIGPRHRSFSVSYETNADGLPRDMMTLLRAIVVAGRGPGQDFEVVQADDTTFHVIGRSVRDHRGATSTYTPLLDTRISLPASAKITDTELVEKIRAAVAAGHVVNTPQDHPFVVIAMRSLKGAHAFPGATNRTAREVLEGVLANAGRQRWSWALLCQPEAYCALNLMTVRKAEGN